MTSKIPLIVGVVLMGLGVPVLLLILSNANGPGTTEEGVFDGPTLPAMEAEKLRLMFKLEEEKSEKVLGGKGVDIIGWVAGKQKVPFGGTTYEGLQLTEEGSIHCAFPEKSREQLKRIRAGEVVRVRGLCRGVEGRRIIITGCRIVPPDED